MIQARSYRGMQTRNLLTANYRYHLLPTDNVTLYRKFSRQHGVDVRNLPQYNIDDWLNPESPNFQPEIKQAIFHYVRKTNIKYHQGLTKDAKATRLAMGFTSGAVFHHGVHRVQVNLRGAKAVILESFD